MSIDESFIQDVEEQLDQLEELVLGALGQEQLSQEGINHAFRVLHTIKGGAYMFGHQALGQFTHKLEEEYEKLRDQKASPTEEQLKLTLQACEHCRNLVKTKAEQLPEECEQLLAVFLATENNTAQEEEKDHLCRVSNADSLPEGHPFHVLAQKGEEQFKECAVIAYPQLPGTLDFFFYSEESVDELKAQLLFMDDVQCNWLETPRLSKGKIAKWRAMARNATAPVEPQSLFAKKKSTKSKPKTVPQTSFAASDEIKTLRVPVKKVDELMNWVSELVTLKAQLANFAQNAADHEATQISKSLQTISQSIQDLTFEIGLVPLKALAKRTHKLLHELSGNLGKPINFQSKGMDTTIGKEVLEQLFDPLMHLVRNAADHGIEDPQERLAAGKPEKGTVELAASKDASHVTITISDDGKGLDEQKIYGKALEKGLVMPDDELTDQQVRELIFLPGFSTAQSVSDVSGRGVGMDVVKKNILGLQGNISIESEKGKGTTFIIKLPLSSSIIDGLLVQIGQERYVLPITEVARIYQVPDQVKNRHNPFIQELYIEERFFKLLNFQPTQGYDYMVAFKFKEGKRGLLVQEVLGQVQSVVKPITETDLEHPYVNGSCILGDGSLALVLNLEELENRTFIPQQTH